MHRGSPGSNGRGSSSILSMKRALKWVGIVVLLLAMALGMAWYAVFGKSSPILDGQKLAVGVVTAIDLRVMLMNS